MGVLDGIEDYTVNGRSKKEVADEVMEIMRLRIEFQKLAQAILLSMKDPVEEVDVKNLDEVQVALRRELAIMVDKLDIKWRTIASAIEKFKYVVQLPKGVQLGGADTITEAIRDLISELQSKEFNPTINTPDVIVPEIRIPEIRVPEIRIPDITVPEARVELDFKPLLDALKPLANLSNKATKPITVRLSDGQKFVQFLKETAAKQERAIQVLSQAAGMTLDDFKTVAGIPKTGGHLKVTVAAAGTPQRVSSTSVPCCEVYLSGDTDAGSPVVVGFSNSVRATAGNKNGILLVPGNTPLVLRTNDLMNLWVDAETSGGVLCVGYSAL